VTDASFDVFAPTLMLSAQNHSNDFICVVVFHSHPSFFVPAPRDSSGFASGVTERGARVRTVPPGKLNVKTDPQLTCISVFGILLVFSRSFFAFFGVFSGYFGF